MSSESWYEQHTLSRKTFLALSAAFGLGLLERPGAALGASKTQLAVALSGGPDTLDPHTTIAGTDWISLANIYDGLFMRDYSSSALPARTIPGLATSYQVSSDGRTYTFKLRRGVKFHDGTPWDADAALFNFRRWFDTRFEHYYKRANATVSGFIGGVVAYDAVDRNTFRIRLKSANGGWFDYFTGAPTFFMVSPAAVKTRGNDGLANHGVGTGPFMVSDYKRNVQLVLERNPSFWGPRPSFERLVIVPVPDDSARVAGIQSGQYDIAQEIAPDSIPILKRNDDVKVLFAGKPVTFGFGGNMKSGAWKDPKVRQAVSLAIYRKGISEKVLQGAGVPATQFYGLGNPAHDFKLPVQDPYDPERAQQVLKSSGYATGLHFSFLTSTAAMGVPEPARVLEAVQSDLEKIGIKSSIRVIEWTSYLGTWFKGTPAGKGSEVPIYTQAMGWDTNMLLQSYAAASSQPPNGVNFVWYDNPRVNKLLADVAKAPSQAAVLATLRAAQRALLRDRPYIYVFHGRAPFVAQKHVRWTPANSWAQRFSRAEL